MSTRAWTVLLLIAGVWGASFLFIRILLEAGIEPYGIAFGRTALGALSLLPFAAITRRHLPSWRGWLRLLGLAAVNFAVPWALIPYAQQYVTSGVAAVANSSMPLWTALFSSLLLGVEELGTKRLAGLVAGFLGVGVLAAPDLAELSSAWRGVPVILFATSLYGFSAVAIRRWYGDLSPFALTFGQLVLSSFMLGPLAFATGAYAGARWSGDAVLSLVTLGAVGSGVAVYGYMWLLREAGAVRASVVTYLIPPTGVLLGWAVLSEPVGWSLLFGLLLILVGVALVQSVPLARVWDAARAGALGR